MQCIGRIYFYAHCIYCLFYCTWSKCSIVFFFIRIGATPNIARIARSSNTCNASISWQTWPSQLHQDDLSECGRIRVLPRLDTDDLPVSLTETDRWTNVGGRSTSANRRLHMFAHVIQYDGFFLFSCIPKEMFSRTAFICWHMSICIEKSIIADGWWTKERCHSRKENV